MSNPRLTRPVLKIEAIAEACRPMAALLLDTVSGRELTASELAKARVQLAAARSAPARIGWAVRIILEGATVGPRMEQAIDIVARVAGYYPPSGAQHEIEVSVVAAYRNVVHELQRPRNRRARGSDSNQPTL